MKYALSFVAVAVLLSVGALATFRHIQSAARPIAAAGALQFPVGDTVTSSPEPFSLAPTRADYSRFAAADSAWRAKNARAYSIAELARRGDGRPTARDSMQDRVFELSKHGKKRLAIAELERWVAHHPRDANALLSLARLFNATGQPDAAIARYRRVLALYGKAGAE